MIRRAAELDAGNSLGADVLFQFLHQARFANPRLAAEQHDLPFAALLRPCATGCPPQPPVFQTDPVEVVVCQPVKDMIQDWDVYTGLVALSGILAALHAPHATGRGQHGDVARLDAMLFEQSNNRFAAVLKRTPD